MDKKEKTKWQRFVIRGKADKSPICGVMYDAERMELMVGCPKGKEDRLKKLFTMLDIVPEEVEEVEEDGLRLHLRVNVDERTWKDLVRRASLLYVLEEAKNFKKLGK